VEPLLFGIGVGKPDGPQAQAAIDALTWAKVSAEVDARLTAYDGPGAPRLRPEEWTSGEIVWLIDMVGDAAGLNVALKTLQAEAWQGVEVKVALRAGGGRREVCCSQS